ncbi:MAG: hypothetical protein M1827_003692 [Pycnora praestabilis]|nr:MAG: hypothetical protein M1827_003692 [Pycnora praestabilis]
MRLVVLLSALVLLLGTTVSTQQCGPRFGRPNPSDCKATLEHILPLADGVDRRFFPVPLGIGTLAEELGLDDLPDPPDAEEFDMPMNLPLESTPQYWASGHCIVVIASRELVNSASLIQLGGTDISSWDEIREDAEWIDTECVGKQGYGGAMPSGQNFNLITYIVEPHSPAVEALTEYISSNSQYTICKNDFSRLSEPGSCPSYDQDPETNPEGHNYFQSNTYDAHVYRTQRGGACKTAPTMRAGQCFPAMYCHFESCQPIGVLNSKVLFGFS